jgi:hypothetical protein
LELLQQVPEPHWQQGSDFHWLQVPVYLSGLPSFLRRILPEGLLPLQALQSK